MVLPLLNDFKTTLGPRKERLGESRVYVNFFDSAVKIADLSRIHQRRFTNNGSSSSDCIKNCLIYA